MLDDEAERGARHRALRAEGRGKPFLLYIVGQIFNLILTFAVVWLLLSGWLFPIPQLAT